MVTLMATLSIYTNINLPFGLSVVCWAFKTMARGQNRAASTGARVQPDSLGIDVRDKELERGIDSAELYASNVDQKNRERQSNVYQCECGWVARVVVCVLPILLLDVLTFSWQARLWLVPLFSKAIFIITECRLWAQTLHSSPSSPL